MVCQHETSPNYPHDFMILMEWRPIDIHIFFFLLSYSTLIYSQYPHHNTSLYHLSLLLILSDVLIIHFADELELITIFTLQQHHQHHIFTFSMFLLIL